MAEFGAIGFATPPFCDIVTWLLDWREHHRQAGVWLFCPANSLHARRSFKSGAVSWDVFKTAFRTAAFSFLEKVVECMQMQETRVLPSLNGLVETCHADFVRVKMGF